MLRHSWLTPVAVPPLKEDRVRREDRGEWKACVVYVSAFRHEWNDFGISIKPDDWQHIENKHPFEQSVQTQLLGSQKALGEQSGDAQPEARL